MTNPSATADGSDPTLEAETKIFKTAFTNECISKSNQITNRRRPLMRFRYPFADDIFISYARRDSSTYATGLADELTKLGFSCFIDRLGTEANPELPDSLRHKLRSCSLLVVVG